MIKTTVCNEKIPDGTVTQGNYDSRNSTVARVVIDLGDDEEYSLKVNCGTAGVHPAVP